MQLVNQTKFPQRGNCFRACLATLLSIDIDEMPPFEEQSDTVWIPAKRWLLEQGLTIRNYHKDFAPKGYSIATGPSPRNPNIYHAVVALDGMQRFDPHPDRSGLVSVERYWQIEELEKVNVPFISFECRYDPRKVRPVEEAGEFPAIDPYENREENFDDDMELASYPEMSHQERYEFRKSNKPSLNFKIDTIAIKIINEKEPSKLEEAPKITIVPSSNNIYADLGFDNAEEMLEKALVVAQVNKNIEALSAYHLALKMPLCEDLNLQSICRGNFRNVPLDRLKKLEADLSTDLDPWEQN